MNPAKVGEILFQALWNIERYIDFHADEEYWNGFPRLRTALAEARQLTQALLPPVILLQEVLEIFEEEVVETLRIRVNCVGERSFSTVNVSVPRTPACDVAGRPPRPPVPNYEFPPEALPSWTRVARALRAHHTAIVYHGSTPSPAYEELFSEGPPASCWTSARTPESPPSSYEVATVERER